MTFSKTLIDWYANNARELPWRQTKDPYLIWISEIILQQTRVDQGLPYYWSFVKSFPNVLKLHQASEDQVLKLWQGLGYYSRARNMKIAAKQIVVNFNGAFPTNYKDIIGLKGIGPYTAAAIASLAFNLPHAVVDGNVYRVLSRYYGIDLAINSTEGQKKFNELAHEVMETKNIGTYNQAIMEFGALYCKPQNPDCDHCPLSSACEAKSSNRVSQLPVKLKKLNIKNRYLNFFLLSNGNEILIEKRDYLNIWKGLYQLPMIETEEPITEKALLEHENFVSLLNGQKFEVFSIQEMQHKLTHRLLFIRFYHLKVEDLSLFSYQKVKISELGSYAFPKPIEKFLEQPEL